VLRYGFYFVYVLVFEYSYVRLGDVVYDNAKHIRHLHFLVSQTDEVKNLKASAGSKWRKGFAQTLLFLRTTPVSLNATRRFSRMFPADVPLSFVRLFFQRHLHLLASQPEGFKNFKRQRDRNEEKDSRGQFLFPD